MKTQILSALVLTGALVAFPGLASAQDAEAKTEAKKVTLKLAMEKGAKLAYETRTKSTTNISGQMPMEITGEDRRQMTYEVTSVADDGATKFKATFGRITGGYSHPMMGETTWDSADPSTQADPMSKAATIMSSKSVNASLDAEGKFTAVEGTPEALGAYAQKLDSDPQLAQLKEQLTDKGQLQSLQGTQLPLPKDAVAVGDSWTETRSVDMGPWTFEMTYTYELEKVEGDLAHLRVKGEGKLTETREVQPGMPPPEMTVNSCLTKGTAQVSLKDGMPRELAITDEHDMVMSMMGMEFPMTISSSRFTKSVDPESIEEKLKVGDEGEEAEKADPDAPAPK